MAPYIAPKCERTIRPYRENILDFLEKIWINDDGTTFRITRINSQQASHKVAYGSLFKECPILYRIISIMY